jgi:uncharacterized protein YkwD
MRFRFYVALIFAITITTFINSPSALAQTSKGPALSTHERELLDEINQARANPQVYATYLEKLQPLFKGKQYTAAGRPALTTEEGWTAVDDAIRFLKAAKPLPALLTSPGLSQAALAHVKDQSGSGATGHRSGNSNMIEDRVKPFGRWQGAIGENISYGNESARERLLTWLIDDGFPSRGHRRRLLGSEYQVAGISCGAHPQFSAMCVLTLAGSFSDMNTATGPAATTPAKNTPAKTKTPAKTTPPKSTGSKTKPAPVKM